jgi:hypothetical protein
LANGLAIKQYEHEKFLHLKHEGEKNNKLFYRTLTIMLKVVSYHQIGATTPSITTFSIMTLRITIRNCDSQDKDAQRKDNQHNNKKS